MRFQIAQCLSVADTLSILAVRNKKRSHDKATKMASNDDDRSGYSLFVHENFELIKKDHSEISTLEIRSILDRQWTSTSEEEKQIWNYRSAQRPNQRIATIPGLPDFELGPPQEDGSDDDESGGRKDQDSRRDHITDSISV